MRAEEAATMANVPIEPSDEEGPDDSGRSGEDSLDLKRLGPEQNLT